MTAPASETDVMPLRCLGCEHRVSAVCDRRSAVECGEEIPRDGLDLGELFERHHRRVVAWACRLTGNYELARDLAQDVFVKALVGLDGFRANSRFTTWLYSITRNCCRDYAKARAARPREVGDYSVVTTPPIAENEAIRSLELESARILVRRLMLDAALDRTERRAVLLHYAGDVPVRMLTAKLQLRNASGAKAPIVSATRKLRAAVARWQSRERRQFGCPQIN